MWRRPAADEFVAARSALLVFDMLECYRAEIEACGVLPAAVRLVELCRGAGVLVCFARAAHRTDGADFSRVVTDVDRDFQPWSATHPQPTSPAGTPDYRSLRELGQRDSDIDVPKHRWSAFHGTALDATLRVQNIGTVMVIGGSTHVGVASTVYAGRDLDYQMIVAHDACTGLAEQRDFFLDRVFPRICRVRTVDQIAQLLH
jgi:nicotinamidase-related amidase